MSVAATEHAVRKKDEEYEYEECGGVVEELELARGKDTGSEKRREK